MEVKVFDYEKDCHAHLVGKTFKVVGTETYYRIAGEDGINYLINAKFCRQVILQKDVIQTMTIKKESETKIAEKV